MEQTKKVSKLAKWLPIMLIIIGVIGTLAAFVITDDKFKILENPNYRPSCSINPVVSCGSVMKSEQSHAFGFPNPIIGLIGFPVVITTGVVVLAGARLKRWYWLGLQAGFLFGLLFVHWLFFQAVYRINALCPYCMAVWVVVIAGFWYVLLYNIQMGHIKLKGKLKRIAVVLRQNHLPILILWYLVLTALILRHFWYFFGRNLPF